MITLIQEAALACIEHALPAGHQSLGTHLDVSWIAATPNGRKRGPTGQRRCQPASRS